MTGIASTSLVQADRKVAYQQFLDRLEPGFSGCSPEFIFDAGWNAALSTAQASEREQIVAVAVERAVAKHGSIIIEPMGDGLGWAATDTDSEDRVWHPLSVARSEPSPVDVERVAKAGHALIANLNGYAARLSGDTIAAVRHLHNALAALQSPPVEQPARAEGESSLLDAARRVVELANNEGVATGNGNRIWGEAVRQLECALSTPQPEAQQPSDGLVEELEFELSSGRVEQYYARLAISKAITALKARTALKTRTSPETEASEAVVEHIAAILEEWDMKQPPDPFTGHDYRDIARDILTRIDAHLSNTPDQGSEQHG